jgi:hypothetical protein
MLRHKVESAEVLCIPIASGTLFHLIDCLDGILRCGVYGTFAMAYHEIIPPAPLLSVAAAGLPKQLMWSPRWKCAGNIFWQILSQYPVL